MTEIVWKKRQIKKKDKKKKKRKKMLYSVPAETGLAEGMRVWEWRARAVWKGVVWWWWWWWWEHSRRVSAAPEDARLDGLAPLEAEMDRCTARAAPPGWEGEFAPPPPPPPLAALVPWLPLSDNELPDLEPSLSGWKTKTKQTSLITDR